MAETSSFPSAVLRKLEELTCPICHHHYISPMILPCLHLFCQQCLERLPLHLQGKKLFLSCPTCRTPTELPEAGVAGFPAAFLINNLTEVYSLLKGSGDQHVLCDNCKSDATGYCKQCTKFHCAKCLSGHITFDHTIINVDEVTRTLKQPDITPVKSKIKDAHKSFEEVTNSKTCRPGISNGKLRRAIVTCRYEAEDSDDISLEVGQIVEILAEYGNGWLIGRVNGVEGVFPSNYVKELDKGSAAIVTYSYEAEDSDELSLVVGQTVENLAEYESGWSIGRVNGVEGVFPSNYVKELDKGSAAIVTYSYEAEDSDELSLEVGQTVEILAEYESGWSIGKVNEVEGGFPSNYVKKLGEEVGKVPTQMQAQRWRPSEYTAVTDTPNHVVNQNKSEEKLAEVTVCSTEKINKLHKSEWFFGKLKRSDAEKKLLQIDNQPGTFLIREDEIHPEKYTLSIRGKEIVNHYRISKVDSSGYYLVPYTKFSSLEDLVKYYQRDSHGLCCRLTVSCPKEGSIKMNKWEIEICSIHIVKRLHVGEFSEVMEGLWNNTTPVAVKIFKTGTIPAQEFLAEAEVMKKLSHPKILQLYAVCTREEPIYIITELMTKGDLLNYLRTEGRHLKLPSLINIGAQIAHGMDYLGSQHHIHRNLAARNVLVGDGNIVKIGGLSLFENNDEYCTNKTASYRRTIKWTAPEAALYNHFTIKSDVWSFGILLYELVTYGRIPYPGMTNAEVLKKVQEGYRMPMPMACPEPLYEIMLDCWRAEPERRLTFEYLYYTLEDFFTINKL